MSKLINKSTLKRKVNAFPFAPFLFFQLKGFTDFIRNYKKKRTLGRNFTKKSYHCTIIQFLASKNSKGPILCLETMNVCVFVANYSKETN